MAAVIISRNIKKKCMKSIKYTKKCTRTSYKVDETFFESYLIKFDKKSFEIIRPIGTKLSLKFFMMYSF